MSSPFSIVLSLKELFAGKLQQFTSDIDDVHCVWLNEIQQEAKRMLTSDFSAEPELMPKTPSQKKNNRRKRVSLGYQEETRAKRCFSKGKRSKLRGSSVKSLDLIAEDAGIPKASTSGQDIEQPKRSTRRNKQTQPEVSLEAAATPVCSAEQVPEEEAEVVDMELETAVPNAQIEIGTDEPQACFSNTTPSPPKKPPMDVSVMISATDRRSAELVAELEASPGRHATKIAMACTPTRAERSSVRHSLKLRYSKAGLRHSMTQDAVRRASRRSILKKRSTRAGNSTCSSNVSDDSCMETDGEVENNNEMLPEEPEEDENAVQASDATSENKAEQMPLVCNERITRSMAVIAPMLQNSPAPTSNVRDIPAGSATKTSVGSWRSRHSGKRKSPDLQDATPTKKPLPPKKSHSVMKPNMRAFLQTVQRNQMLMMTPTSGAGSTVMKSFIKHTTPLKVDQKDWKNGLVSRERLKLEALKKKQEQEEERIKKMEEEKKRKLEEQKRKRDERLRKVVESRMKEDEEKKKRMEQKMSQTDEKNDKMRIERLAEEKAKKKVALKRQEEVEQKKRLEEEARLRKIQLAEEEKRQQELVAKQAAEEEERARKMAEARRALELRRERELEKERQAVAERERVAREKALALQRELERAAREKERRELEERRQLEEKRMREEQEKLRAEKAAREMEAAKQKMASASVALNVQSPALKTPAWKGAALNVTVEVEKSPQSYSLTPKGGNKPLTKSTNADDYGMDQKSDDSTDDESAPRKPIPSWAEGQRLQEACRKQYFHPPDLHTYFGKIEPPSLENIFYKSKPRYFKRTSSAVWHSPPRLGHY